MMSLSVVAVKDQNAPLTVPKPRLSKTKNENVTPKKKGAGGGADRGSEAKKALLDQ